MYLTPELVIYAAVSSLVVQKTNSSPKFSVEALD